MRLLLWHVLPLVVSLHPANPGALVSGRELVHPGDQIRCLCRGGIEIVAGRHVHGRYLGRVTSTGIERNGRLPDVQMWLEQQGMDTYLDWQA